MLINTKTALIAWAALRSGSNVDKTLDVATVKSPVSTAFGNVRFAMTSDGRSRLLLPLRPQERTPKLPITAALKVEALTLFQQNKALSFLAITCNSPELDKVFSDVTEAILERIVQGCNVAEACISTIIEFQALLVLTADKSVEPQIVQGLLGELLVLEAILKYESGAADCWRGPLGERHDFRNNSMALEVKTTNRKDKSTITISSADQLSAPYDGSLHICHIVLEPVNKGLDVATQFNKILDLYPDTLKIRERLALLGCNDPNAIEWNTLKFHIENINYYIVNDLFPKITALSFIDNHIPIGIHSIKYNVDLTVAHGAMLNDAEINELFVGITA